MLSGPGTSASSMYSNAGERFSNAYFQVKMPSLTTKSIENKGPKRKKEAEGTAVPDFRNIPRKEDTLQWVSDSTGLKPMSRLSEEGA
ncbi:hypothetical protein NDU88_007385 [Pleurodeles waltl]|uniref:Uncharacterized protein n=1 Tax=Pleurodeles waltl TaxID=8319 RepID=A0AAV7RSA4_PLEWA|nr:hypothetical protein NDU88_007385 [Pleurodeles waltl]